MITFFSIIINHSIFYLFVFLFISCFLSYFLYRNHSSLVDVPKPIKLALFTLRSFSLFFLFLLLLQPEFKKQEKIEEEPLIVFLQDNSSSIISNSDSAYYKLNYISFLDSLFESVESKVEVISFSNLVTQGFSEFSGETTNLSLALNTVNDIYSNTNVQAYIMASDGIYNQGMHPLYLETNLNAPLYTLLLGDTVEHPDALIKSVRSNKITYLGNETPVEVIVKAHQMNNTELLIEVFDDSTKSIIYSEKIKVSSSNYLHKISFFISADVAGVQKYYVQLKSTLTEKNKVNNKQAFFIDVIDNRKKVLLLFSTPHPDVGVIKESLELHDQYELDVERISTLGNDVLDINAYDYSLVILHQLTYEQTISQIRNLNSSTPVWHIIGQNSDLRGFNNNQNFVKFINEDNSFEYENTLVNRNFSSFLMNDSLIDFLSLSSPFLMPFSNVSITNLTDVLLYKKIGSLNTQQPILFFVEDEYKSGYLLGEGLWRWRLNDAYLNNNNELFNQFIGKIIQYLLLDEEKSRIHINYRPLQSSHERIIFEAELYNKNFELTNSQDISMKIVDSLGNHYDYQFNPHQNKYSLDIGLLPAGSYDFFAESNFGNDILSETGTIVVSDFSLEKSSLVANHTLLSAMSFKYNGSICSINNLSNLLIDIVESSDFKPKTYINYYYQPLIHFQLLLILLLTTLFLEWFLRRRYINY